MQNPKKYDTNELIYKTEIDSQTQRMNLCLPGEGQGEGIVREFGIVHVHTAIFKTGDFPGGAVVKNPPANAGDMSFIPSPGGSHMPWNN